MPKGKVEPKEETDEAAIREVMEECSVDVHIVRFLAESWHTYPLRGKVVLKKTYWYLMECTNDLHLKPQLEEGIEKVMWVDITQLPQVLNETYDSIRDIINLYLDQRLQLEI